jgi:hypothetical protein
MATAIISVTRDLPESDRLELLNALAALLFLATGKSDNNTKCQLPLYLRDTAGIAALPKQTASGEVVDTPVPRTLKSDAYMATISGLSAHPVTQSELLMHFIGFLLSDDAYVEQLFALGRAYYYLLEEFDDEAPLHLRLLAPLVTFQVRGSVTASGGHDPEELLRGTMIEWGLEPGVDFNRSDVILGSTENGTGRTKTRAFDFVLPYMTPGWTPQILVQCQFYAGDSGSVSHKNVDQTRASRDQSAVALPQARHIEYLDGAGYYSSLNGDLKSLLAMEDTRAYFQIRSSAIRLRRELQDIGYLTPLEFEQAAIACAGVPADTEALLLSQGYIDSEIQRVVDQLTVRGTLVLDQGAWKLAPERVLVATAYAVLDFAAIAGEPFDDSASGEVWILVPGYGPFFGAPLRTVEKTLLERAPGFATQWTADTLDEAIAWLLERRYVRLSDSSA